MMRTGHRVSRHGGMIFAALIWVVGITGFSASALAHRVTIFAWVQDGVVHTESKFSAGKMVQGGTVTVYDPNGVRLLTGKTDQSGAYSFKAPQVSDLRIVLKAAMGHQNEWLVKASEIAPESAPPALTDRADAPESTAVSEAPTDIHTPSEAAVMDARAMDALLDRKLGPILHKLTEIEAEKGVSVSDVMGGIGYILGLMGIGAYFHSKRDQTR